MNSAGKFTVKSFPVTILILICLLIPTFAYAETEATINDKLDPIDGTYYFVILKSDEPQMYFNGNKENIETSGKKKPVVKNGEFLLDATLLLNKLGANVKQDTKGAVTINYSKTKITLKSGSTKLYLNGNVKNLKVAPQKIGSAIYIPIKAVAEVLGFKTRISNEGKVLAIYTDALKSAYQSSDYTLDDLAIYDAITKKIINVGMKKVDVDNKLGKQTKKDFKGFINYNGLEIFYRDDIVAGMIINAGINYTGRFVTIRKLGLGTTRAEVIGGYGESIEEGVNCTYLYSRVGEKLNKIDMKHMTDTSNIYGISMLYSDRTEGVVTYINIGDYRYLTEVR